MARITLNPMFDSVHGKTCGMVFYFRGKDGFMRQHVKGRNRDTEAQRFLRGTFRDAVRSWQALPEADKNRFNRKAAYMNKSGYNLYISGYMKTKISTALKDVPGKEDKEPLTYPSPRDITSVSPPFISQTMSTTQLYIINSGPG